MNLVKVKTESKTAGPGATILEWPMVCGGLIVSGARRASLLGVLLLAGVTAGAAVYTTKWSMETAARDSFGVTRSATPDTVWLHAEVIAHKLTREEAASLGRALLEAAGETEKKTECSTWKVTSTPILGTVTTECSPEKCPELKRFMEIK